MPTKFLLVVFLFCCSLFATAQQQDKNALQKQRDQLKNDIAETQKILDETKKTTSVNIGQLSLIDKKLTLQNNVVSSINNEIKTLTDDIYLSQLEINKMKRVLDTLKVEYANSMVYAYKNSSNYNFLNFIFSATNFNDAIKRVAYLKSYRNYREKQGENILKTQAMLENNIAELSDKKNRKSTVLIEQGKELSVLEVQKKEKAEIVNQLRGKTKELNATINNKKKQDAKLRDAITAMIRREVELAKAEAAKKEKERLAEINRQKAAEAAAAKALKDAQDLAAAEAKKNETSKAPANNPPATEKPTTAAVPKVEEKPAPKPVVKETPPAPAKPTNVLVSSEEEIALNSNFEKNKGSLPWPATGYVITHFGINKLPGNIEYYEQGITLGTRLGEPVKAIFEGDVTVVSYVENSQTVMIRHGKYFTIYSNLNNVSVQKGTHVKTGQVIGTAAQSDEGDGGSVQFLIMKEYDNVNPEAWLRK